jgi:hypothetical protein
MTLLEEAQSYWKLCKRYRSSLSKAGKTLVASHDIPTLKLRATNPRIINQLSNIMSQEGVIDYAEDHSADPCA